LTTYFQTSGIQKHDDVKTDATIKRYEFLDKYIKPLNLEDLECAKKLISFIEQAIRDPEKIDSFHPAAKGVLVNLQRDGWKAGLGTIRRSSEKEIELSSYASISIPSEIERLLQILINGLIRAMNPLKRRRKGAPYLRFDNEYDVQDLLHSLLRPWIADIRSEEYTPSYAGSSTRIDFLLAEHDVVIEVKYIRDPSHARKVGDELILDIAHYRAHPQCKSLWIVVYDSEHSIPNPGGLIADLENGSESIKVRVFVVSG
jgi:hypothetical protein